METIAYKCINCGGPLEYNAAKQKFACEYCRSEFTEEQLRQHFGSLDENLSEAVRSEEQTEQEREYGAALFTCQSCGAEVIAETGNTAATFCVYCHIRQHRAEYHHKTQHPVYSFLPVHTYLRK